MSRVYDTPRYEDQTLNKVLLHLDVSRMQLGFPDIRDKFGNPRVKSKTFDSIKYELQQLDLIDADEIKCIGPDELEDVDLYQQYYVGDAIGRQGIDNLSRTVATGKSIYNILTRQQYIKKTIWCDYDASIRIMHGYLSGKYSGSVSGKDIKIMQFADVAAKDLTILSLSACRMGGKILDLVRSKLKTNTEAYGKWRNMIIWNRGMELVRLKSMTPEAISAHDEIRDGSVNIDFNKFDVSETKAARTIGAEKMFRIMGLYIIEYADAIYILDYSSLDQVHQVSKMWEGFYKYVSNYRISGMGKCLRELNTGVLDKCVEWLCRTLEYTNFSDEIARSMKQSLALLQNDMHNDAERLEVNSRIKSEKLEAMIKDVITLESYWHNHLRSLGITVRCQLDLAHIFYALPAPDCNLKLLYERASVYMQNANKADPFEFHDFMKYCMAVDFCKAVTIYKGEVTYEKTEGYDFTESNWFKSCMRGKLQLPPDEDMGKVWVKKFFPFNNTLPQWYWEAADVTHVLSESHHYKDLSVFSKLPRSSHNELLYALDHAPKLSNDWDPDDVMVKLGTGEDKWDRMAVMAVKCENTKPKKKNRETWSADDITRELTTCYDRAAIPIAAMYSGVTARKSDIEVQNIFDRICSMTRSENPKRVIIMSNDVSGWSPMGDREAWSMHHDYLIGMTKAPENLQLKSIWNKIHAYVAKRGFIASTSLDKGLFQGWTGTCDSIFNVHISLYCVRKAKRAGLLLFSESATTAGLIDDAVQAVELDARSTLEHQQNAADNHFKTTAETWRSLGAELDVVKTIYSSSKFIYLNRFFCEGSEVLIPMKIFARADKEFNRRFAPVFSQMDTILGSYRAAVEKGACPIVGYYFAMNRCLTIACYSNFSLVGKDLCSVVNACFAPRGLGGWGIPHITAWLTQEAQDSLSMYTTIMASVIQICSDRDVSERFNDLLIGTLNQEFQIIGVKALLSDPTNVIVQGLNSPESEIHNKLKSGMIRKCKSTVFKRALEAGESKEVMEILSKIIRCCRWDVTILELLGQCLPSTCSAALVDRAYKNELVTQLFPFRVRSEMSSIIRKGSAQSVVFLVDKRFGRADIMATRSMAYDLAFECRSRFYHKNEIEVSNHTIPDYGTCLSRQFAGENPGLIVKTKWPKPSCRIDSFYSRNLYDGMAHSDKSRTPRAISAYTFTGERFRYMTPVQRCVCKSAVVATYLTTNGANGKLFWDLTMALWGASTMVTAPVVTTQIKPGTSTKRLSASKSHLTHSIAAFRNVHNCVEVIADPIGSYLSAKTTHVDYLSIVTAARFIGLINLAISNSSEQLEDLHFGFLEGSIPMTEEDKLTVFDPESLDVLLRDLVKVTDKSLFPQVLESMKDVQYSKGEDEEYICIGFTEEHYGTARIGQEISISAGYLSNIVHSGVIMPTAVRKRTSLVRLAGDEVIARPTLKADTRMRNLTKLVPSSQAVLCLAMETVKDLCPGGLKMNIAQAPWSQVASEFRSTFTNWGQYWTNVVGLMKRYTTTVDRTACEALLGRMPHHIITHLEHLDERVLEESSLVVAYLYLASYGRLRAAESYTLTSAIGITQMSRCWNLASRIRKEPSKKWRSRLNRESNLMGDIYHSLAMATQNYYNKLQVLRAISTGISFYLNRYHAGCDFNAPEVDGRFFASTPNTNPYWHDIREEIMNQLTIVQLNTPYIRNNLDQLANDIFMLGEVKLLTMKEEPVLYVPQPFTVTTVELPVIQEMDVEEEEITTKTTDPLLLKAAVANIECGIDFAMLVYRGEEDYTYEEEPTEDEIAEFISELNEYTAQPEEGQAPDEAL